MLGSPVKSFGQDSAIEMAQHLPAVLGEVYTP